MVRTGLRGRVVTKDLGTVQPGPAVSAEEAYVSAFFGHWLRGQDGHLLAGPSPRYPQIALIR